LRPPLLAVPLAAALAACATAPPAETERLVAGPPVAAAERIEAALNALGLRRTQGSAGVIEAETRQASTAWASCLPMLVSDGDDRRRMVTAEQRRASVRVDLAPAGPGTSGPGTTVRVTSSFVADYRNPISGYGFERDCSSRGVVERTLLDAAAT
jgi:hypothetical protein